MVTRIEDKIYGCLLAGMIGDAMGAPTEGWPYQQIYETYGPQGITNFDGIGTDDTLIREQLVDALLGNDGYVTCDEFAESFPKWSEANYQQWWIPVRNMYHKVSSGITLPVDAGWGNMQSTSSAMAISPMGIVNACDPRRAALETFDVASLMHSGPAGFCRDAACATAAAVAQAFAPGTTVGEVVDASTQYLHKISAAEVITRIRSALALAEESGTYEDFRQRFHEDDGYLLDMNEDSREIVPLSLALFRLADGDVERTILWSANFGRNTDTIAAIAGGLAGAYQGIAGVPERWLGKVDPALTAQYRGEAGRLAELVSQRAGAAERYARAVVELGRPTPSQAMSHPGTSGGLL